MNNNESLVSVIMACYNEEIEWINKSIQSILNQTYTNLEFIIICDNPKNIELKEVLLNYGDLDERVKLHFNENNLGLIESLNIGLKNCTGNYIARMDADDISHIDRIRKQIEYFEKNRNIQFVMSGVNIINELDEHIGKTKELKHKNIYKLLSYGNISIHPTWMFKREILQKVHKYNEVKYVEDYDFLCRTILEGYKVGFISDYLLDYRVRENGITKSRRAEQEFIYQIVIESYRNSLKRGKEYNVNIELKSIDKKKIKRFEEEHERFQVAKNNLRRGKVIKGILEIFKIILESKIKRKQIINFIRLKFMSKIY